MKRFVSVSFILLAVVVALVIFGIIYYFIYKSIINKKIENGDYETGKTKRRIPSFSGVIAFILAVIVIVGYININNKLNILNDVACDLSRTYYNVELLESKINSLENKITALQEEIFRQDSDVNYLKYSFGDFYEEDHTADIIFKLSLKNYSKSDIVSLYFSEWGDTVELTETGEGIFEGKLRADIFNCITDKVQYTIKKDNTVATGMVMPESDTDKYAVTDIWEYYLLYPKYDFGSPEYKYSNGKLSYELQGEIIPMNYVGNDINGFVESVKIITKLDDKVIDEYKTTTANYSFNLKETRDVRTDQNLEIYAEITDKYGFIYKIPMTGWTDNSECIYFGDMAIFDRNGKLLKEVYM